MRAWNPVLVASIAFLMLLVGCGPSASPPGVSQPSAPVSQSAPRRITAAIQGDPPSFHPALNPAGAARGSESLTDLVGAGLAIVDNTLYMAALRGTQLWQMRITGTTTTTPRAYFTGTYGRLRTVEPSPAGGLWLTTSNGGDKDSTPNNSDCAILNVEVNDP